MDEYRFNPLALDFEPVPQREESLIGLECLLAPRRQMSRICAESRALMRNSCAFFESRERFTGLWRLAQPLRVTVEKLGTETVVLSLAAGIKT